MCTVALLVAEEAEMVLRGLIGGCCAVGGRGSGRNVACTTGAGGADAVFFREGVGVKFRWASFADTSLAYALASDKPASCVPR